jgi:pyruvate dehydrogenase E2 component (dihydrolipoamide acetyltransferase)
VGDFRMPSLGADMDRGVLLEWKVKPGDIVQRGDIVAVVDTDKSDIEIEVFEAGTIAELLVAEGAEVPVGTVLARLDTSDGVAEPAAPAEPATPTETAEPDAEPAAPTETAEPDAEPAAPPAPAASAEPATQATQAEPAAEPAQTGPGGRVLSPLVRRLADQRGVDLDALVGTGPGGRVSRRDVEASAAAARAVPMPPPADRAVLASHRTSASPLARRRAAQLGIDLAQVSGTGPGGAVRVGDVDRVAGAVAPTEPAEAAEVRTPARRDRAAAQRAATAALMARSKQEIPHYYLRTTIDLSSAQAWLEEQNRDRSVADRLLLSVLLLKASALAVAAVPDLNGHWVDDALHRHDAVDLGVAVALRGGGLIAPAIHDAETRGLDELMAGLRDLVARARAGRLRGSDLTDPSITVTNLGDQGVEEVFGVIYPPQVALVGFGRVAGRPWAEDGMLAVRPVVTATLAADHRATTGHEGSRYLARLDQLLQEPEAL